MKITLTLATFLLFFQIAAYAEDMAGTEVSGAELWKQNCGRCHNYRGVSEFSDPQWDIIMGHMRVIGNIPGGQARAILKFLQETNNPPIEIEIVSVEETMEMMPEGDALAGGQVFAANCSSCHGGGGKGDGPVAVSLDPKPRDLTDSEYIAKIDDQYLMKVIKAGGYSVGKSPLMPAWGTVLTEKQIADLIAHIRSLSRQDK